MILKLAILHNEPKYNVHVFKCAMCSYRKEIPPSLFTILIR